MIPDFNENGLLSADYKPIKTNITELIDRFCTSNKRAVLLKGLLNYRKELSSFDIKGFQWIDGSFVTNKENREIDLDNGKDPNDIDVLTIYKLPIGETQSTMSDKMVFDKNYVKRTYSVDAFLIEDKNLFTENGLLTLAHWITLYSHTRNGERKNFLQLSLEEDDCDIVLDLIKSKYEI